MNTPRNSIIYVPSSPSDARRSVNRIMASREFPDSEQAQLDKALARAKTVRGKPAFSRSDYSDVRAFFDEASVDYDSDQLNPYWSFTHEILRFILTKFITEHFSDGQAIRLFDAGAGTGNWSRFVLGLSDRASGILFDINTSMLRLAYPKVTALSGSSVQIVEGNLETPGDFPSERSNLALCMHNVIGLGRNTPQMLRNLYIYLEQDSLAFIMATNKYHAFNFAIQHRGEAEVTRVAMDGTIKFKSDMPEMFCYTPQEFEELLKTAGFNEVTVLGFPITIYPEAGDTKLLKKETNENSLRHPKTRNALLNLEKSLCLNPHLAYRAGSSLIAVCKKNAQKS